MLTTVAHDCLQVQRRQRRLVLGLLLVALPTLGQVPTGTATFVKTDISTAGTWKGVYGADGFNVIGDSASVPGYVTVTPSGNSSYVWASSTSDTRALQKASSPADRMAACWYSPGQFTIDLAFKDSNTHPVAVYLVDWDNFNGRAERVDVIDASNNLLDTRSVSSFTGGQYLVWNLSGHVILRITNTKAPNAVVSGLFFGAGGSVAPALPPTGTATFVRTDISTAGTWKGVYGTDGFNVIGNSASVPAYVTVTPSGSSSYVWASSTSDTRALQTASNPADRIAACWYSSGSFTIDLAFHDSNTHQVAAYLLDWDNYYGRTERVDVIDANNNLLDSRSVSSFTGGQYLVWNLSGHVILRVTNTNAPSNAVIGGLFFGASGLVPAPLPPTGAATFVRTDISTAGTWKGVYGADGFNVIGNSASVPAYVTVTPSGSSSYLWASSTGDTRALQTAANPADRMAACWYSSGQFTVDLAFHDSNTHQVAAYLLDWDNSNGRTERVDVIDANNTLLDTRSVSNFRGGQYLIWNLSGHVILRVTNTNAPSNAVISGLFFGTLQPTVSVSVSPSSVNLLAGGSQQFSATVLGSANTSVTWWVNPAVGTISSGGLYTAPATLSSPQTVTVTATSTANANNQAAATVTITPPVTVSLTPTAATMLPAQGQTFTATVGGTSNSGVKWSMAPATGTISSSGLYTAPPAILSTSSVMVTATSAADATKSASAAITLIPAITIMRTSQLSGTAGTAYSAAVSAIGGVTPYTWSIASGQLPPGTSLSTSTGAISGTPTTAGSYNVTMKVTDAAGYQATAALAIVIAAASCTGCPGLGITTTSLPAGTVGSVYSATLAPTGGTSPYTWSISAGQLPPGLTLSSATGAISGTPSSTGSYNLTVMVTDSASPHNTASQALACTISAPTAQPQAGGLSSYFSPASGPNLLLNPGFESWTAGVANNWSYTDGSGTVFIESTSVHHSSAASFEILNSNRCTYYCNAVQTLTLQPGVYDFSGWIKTSSIGAFRFQLPNTQSQTYTGTMDWTYVTVTKIAVATAGTYQIIMYPVKTSGTVWVDDLSFTQEQTPISVFMQYPNFKGMIFDDQSQIAVFNIVPNPSQGTIPSDTTLSDYRIDGTVETAEGSTVLTGSWAAASSLTATFDFSSLAGSTQYKVAFQLTHISDGTNASSSSPYPYYTVYKYPASTRTRFNISTDQNQRILYSGVPTFVLGVYDAGESYYTDQATWDAQLTAQRRLFDLPINLYLNYQYGGAPNSAIVPLLQDLQSHGIGYLDTANCFSSTPIAGNSFFDTASNADVQARAATLRYLGVYRADECISSEASEVFSYKARTDSLNPGGYSFGALLGDSSLPLWRDTVDQMATDPYPFYGSTGPYNLGQVASSVGLAMAAVQNSRPVLTVIQEFGGFGSGPWPTQDQMRNMSYMAITSGANGLLYWSIGQGGLADICDGSDGYHSPSGESSWCQAKTDHMGYLTNVVTELNSLQGPLSQVDDTTDLKSHDQSGIQARVKSYGGKKYLIASNTTNGTLSSTFTWHSAPLSITVYNEGRSITASGVIFTDSFGPYAAHVYQIVDPLN